MPVACTRGPKQRELKARTPATPSPLEHRHIQAGWGAWPGDGHAAQQDFLWGLLMGGSREAGAKETACFGVQVPLTPQLLTARHTIAGQTGSGVRVLSSTRQRVLGQVGWL